MWRKWPDIVNSFLKNRRGATAVEFSLLVVPLTALLLCSMQTTFIYFFDQALQTAAQQSTRQLMTGAAQTAGMTQAQFHNVVCNNAGTAFTCNNIMVDVQSASSFSALTTAPINLSYNASGAVTNTFNYNPGGPGSITITRVMYLWPVVWGGLIPSLATQPNGNFLLVATVVSKNEPY
jgi:Flp pilus assembly protein TadG